MTQSNFLDDLDPAPRHCQPLHAKALARATHPPNSHAAAREVVESGNADSQCQAILELLRLRPATAKELVALSVNYRARISDCRNAGKVIKCRPVKSHATGKAVNWYFLEE